MSGYLDDLAEQMLAPATRLVVAVHDGDAATSHDVLARLGVLELRALAVTLAALVPDDQALTALTAWTRGLAPVSDRQAAAHRELLEAEVAAFSRSRRGAA
ncbi:hypothetical protein ABZ917_17755 [Nonomuraea wenchangensis]